MLEWTDKPKSSTTGNPRGSRYTVFRWGVLWMAIKRREWETNYTYITREEAKAACELYAQQQCDAAESTNGK